jgi:predicted phosphate transport protein (TIGR00153 family)
MALRLLPQEEHFYLHFQRQAEVISAASALLLDQSRHIAQAAEYASQIRDLEHKGDTVVHEIFLSLNRTFLTPIEPEDIHTLASTLDDVVDGIEDVAHRMEAYGIKRLPESVQTMCEILAQCSGRISNALDALAKNQPVIPDCIEINRLEDEADHVVRRAVTDLMDTEPDPVEVLKVKEVYEYLEATVDRCEDVADVLQNVTVKNS